MRVFHFILDHRTGGPHVYVQTLKKAIGESVRSTIVTGGKGPMTDIALANFRHFLRILYPLEVFWNTLCLYWRFRRHSSRKDLVFDVHGAANIAPIAAARILGVPLVWHFHETLAGHALLAKLGKFMASGCTHTYVTVAQKAAEAFCLPQATLIPGGVDTEFWHRNGITLPTEKKGKPLQVVAIGNLNPLKGMDLLLEALALHPEPWRLSVVGSELTTYKSYEQALKQKAATFDNFQHRVEFLGWQSPVEVRALLAQSDLFVLPSRSEACPLALLEAMSMECPCIGTDVGDVRTMLENGNCGIVASSPEAHELAAALASVTLLSTEARQAMGRRARQRVMDHYSETQLGQAHLAIYQGLIQMIGK